MTTDAEKIEAVLLKLETDSGKLHDVVHGSDTATISVTSGNVSSMAKAIKDISSAGTTEVNKVKNDGAQAITTFSTDSGSAITKFNTDGAAAIATIVDSLKYALKDFSNITINGALGKLGLEGLNRNKNLDSYTDNTSLSAIAANSIYSYPTTATDSPKASSAGIVQTWIIDANNATQVSITTSAISTSDIAVQYRVKTGGTYGNWQALGGGASTPVTPPYTPATVTKLPIIGDGQGSESGAIILKDGTLRMWGRGAFHQLGQGDDVSDKNSPVTPLFPSSNTPKIKRLFKSERCCVAQDTSNDIWVWGHNKSGCLGVGHSAVVKIPTKLNIQQGSFLENFIIKSVSIWFGRSDTGSTQHCAMVSEGGVLAVCGSNSKGQLGLGSLGDQTTFQKISTDASVNRAVAVGWTAPKTYYISDKLYGTGETTSQAPLGENDSNTRRTSFVFIGTFYDDTDSTKLTTNYIYADICIAYDGSHYTAIVGWSPQTRDLGTIYQFGNDDMYMTPSVRGKTNYYPEFYARMRGNTNWVPNFTLGENIMYYTKDKTLYYKYGDRNISRISRTLPPADKGTYVQSTSSIDFTGKTITKTIFSNNDQMAVLLSDFSIYALGYNAQGNLGLADNSTTFGYVHGTTGITDSDKQVVDIAFVGFSTETSLCYITREGKYYQTGPLGNNYIFLTDKATNVPIEIKFQ